MSENYVVEKCEDRERGGVRDLVRKNISGNTILYVSGLSTADTKNSNRPRTREEYIAQFLNPMITQGSSRKVNDNPTFSGKAYSGNFGKLDKSVLLKIQIIKLQLVERIQVKFMELLEKWFQNNKVMLV